MIEETAVLALHLEELRKMDREEGLMKRPNSLGAAANGKTAMPVRKVAGVVNPPGWQGRLGEGEVEVLLPCRSDP